MAAQISQDEPNPSHRPGQAWPSSRINLDPPAALLQRCDGTGLRTDWPRNFLRCAKCCADGGTILTEAEDRTIRLFSGDHSNSKASEQASEGTTSDHSHPQPRSSPRNVNWAPCLDLAMADAVLSTCWYPYSTKNDPSRHCFVVAVKDHPIQLLDATHGALRASYPIIDHRERMVAPHSMLFSQEGSTLYAGFESAIEVFDVSRPGQAGERHKTLPSRNSKDGQKGIISALASHPANKGCLAAGSYSGQIALYDTQSAHISPEIIFKPKRPTGITQLKFHPVNDQVLFSVSRMSNEILCWDLRYSVETLHSFRRPGWTNQKIGFDVDWMGLNLITGGTDGKLRVYRLDDFSQPVQCLPLHSDTIGSVAFHPTDCSILSSSGSRKKVFSTMSSPSIESLSSSDSESNSPSLSASPDTRRLSNTTAGLHLTELCLWKFTYMQPESPLL